MSVAKAKSRGKFFMEVFSDRCESYGAVRRQEAIVGQETCQNGLGLHVQFRNDDRLVTAIQHNVGDLTEIGA